MARSDIYKEPSGNKSAGAPKVAATYSPTMQCSTIGDAELNDPVRNGKGWDLSAITTLIIVLMFYCFNVLRTNSKPTQKHKGLTHWTNAKHSRA